MGGVGTAGWSLRFDLRFLVRSTVPGSTPRSRFDPLFPVRPPVRDSTPVPPRAMSSERPVSPGVWRPLVWTSEYEVDIGAHVFPTRKYRRVRERLIERGLVAPGDFLSPEPASREDLLRVHTAEYLAKVDSGGFTPSEAFALEVPWSPELRRAVLLCCGGTTLAGRLALAARGTGRAAAGGAPAVPGEAPAVPGNAPAAVAVHVGGGFHHAFAGHGEGFCLLNDIAVAASTVIAAGEADRVAVVDLDVHHGNGTAHIFRDDPAVFTFSMHEEGNYPAIKPPGDLDVGLDRGTGDAEYLELLERHLPKVLEGHRPELVIYLAGADPYRGDQLGGLALTVEGLRARDRMVVEACRDAGAALAVTLAGGYAFNEDDTVEIHLNTVREALWPEGPGAG
jgi:acetoin utilization deacetylase AcuC-like enzyme